MKAGSLVICIDDSNYSFYAKDLYNKLPKKYCIYRIRRIIPHITDPDGPDGVALEGIFGKWEQTENYKGQPIFEEYHFRKNRFAEIKSIPENAVEEVNLLIQQQVVS